MSSSECDSAGLADARPASLVARRDGFAWRALLATVFLVPLATTNLELLGIPTPLTFDMFGTVKMLLLRLGLIAVAAAWLWTLTRGEDPALRRSPADVIVVALLGWLAFTSVFAVHTPTAVFGAQYRNGGLLTYAVYAGLFFMTVQLAVRSSRVKQFARVLFASGAIVSAYGLVQYLGLDPINWQVPFVGRAFSTFGNPGLLGNFLMFYVPVAVALGLTERRRGWRALLLGGAVLGGVVLLATFARSAWIGGVVALVVLAVVAWRQRVALDRTVDTAFAVAGSAAVAFLAWSSARSADPVTDITARIASLLDFGAGGTLPRVEIYRSAFAALADRPLLGFGLDTFGLVFPAYRTEEFGRLSEFPGTADMVHSLPLQIAVTAGLPALALMVALVAVVAVLSVRTAVRRPCGEGEAGSAGRILMGGLAAGCAGYLISALFAITHPETDFLLWVCMGVLVAPAARAVPLRLSESGRTIMMAGAGTMFAAAAVGSLTIAYADNLHLQARILPNGAERIAAADSTVRLAPFSYSYRSHRGAVHAEVALNEIVRLVNAGTPPDERMRAGFERTVDTLEETVAFCPWDRDARYFLVAVYNFGGSNLDSAYHVEALHAVDEALARMPNDPQLHYQRVVALRGLGRPDEALAEARETVRLEPRFGEGAVLLAELLVESGDTPAAIEVLQASEQVVVNSRLVRDALRSLEAEELEGGS